MGTVTVYFEKPGEQNTSAVFRNVKQRAEELGIKTVLAWLQNLWAYAKQMSKSSLMKTGG